MKVVEIVRSSWDKIGSLYDSYRDKHKIDNELEEIVKLLPVKAKVLDVGSGSGEPVAKFLVEKGINVTGIDISKNMVELAQKNVPQATFIQMDMLTLNFEENSFDGIICVYSLWHVPKKEHTQIYKAFHRILKPNGLLVINTGIRESEGMSDFFGEPMLWSNHDPKTTLKLVKEAGFTVDFEGILERGGEYQYWIFART
ncbi:MAG: class I SAM-dependent methyltransferase [Candidatus Heimdallarchaeota archaeon]|nr:class I SAM-dependent methyltransferase [Candidatus Heimdallarchaeota archaeon]